MGVDNVDAREFFVGVNLPWLNYGCDFGANAWQPQGGVGQPERRRRLEEIFARLAAKGLCTVRWFVFCDGRCGIRFDASGVPRGVGPLFERDFETALWAAGRHGLSLMPVLFDYLCCLRARRVNGVQVGGMRRLFARPHARRALLETVGTLVGTYGREPVIRSWDLFNEPEWATLGYGALNPWAALCPRVMRAALKDLATVARGESRQGTTVGLASPRGLRLLQGVPIDEIQVHWYDRRSAHLYQLPPGDRPVLLGEFPTRGSAAAPAELVDAARRLGYCGALGWSALASDGHTDLDALERAV